MGAQNWLEAMPAIPLTRGVPVVQLRHNSRSVVTRRKHDSTDFTQVWWFVSHSQYLVTKDSCRVDLADPQGFGYALRQGVAISPAAFPAALERALGGRCRPGFAVSDLLDRWVMGIVTDADRLALAKAIAEVLA